MAKKRALSSSNGWGEILNVSNAKGSEIGTINPMLYRGYYYDSELNMYYLQSRHYDPVMKRMIASDDESLKSDATFLHMGWGQRLYRALYQAQYLP